MYKRLGIGIKVYYQSHRQTLSCCVKIFVYYVKIKRDETKMPQNNKIICTYKNLKKT